MEKQIIPIVFATDENYVPYCGVAISSLIKNTNCDNIYEVYILFDTLSNLSIYRLEKLSTDNVRVSCLCVHDRIANLKVVEYNHLTVASAYRLVVPDVFPQYEKMIYLDSDIIVNADVAELYNIDIGKCVLGAVRGYYNSNNDDWMHNHITKTLQIGVNCFFNAGILIINTIEFKKNDVAKKCFSLLSARKDLYFLDQCALNIVCEEKVFFLPSKWNHEWLYLFATNNPSLPKNREEFETCKKPAIIHYDGTEKPWDHPQQFLSDYFWAYARQSIFYEEIIYSAQFRRTRELLELFGIVGKFGNIAIYGAGNAGKRYVNKILALNLCKIVLWVDKNYAEKKGYELPVENIEKLFSTEFDHVLIAIENADISNKIKEMLISNNIPSDKILQVRETKS